MEGEGTGSARRGQAGSGGPAPKALTAKYYSPEEMSAEKYLPKYEPLHMTLNVNGTAYHRDAETACTTPMWAARTRHAHRKLPA